MRNILFLMLVSCFITGCSSVSHVSKYWDVPEEKGVLLLSFTDSSDYARKELAFKDCSTNKEYKIDHGVVPVLVRDDFPSDDKDGPLFALELEPGKHVVSNYCLLVPQGVGTDEFSLRNAPPLPFQIEKGKVTYIGNFNMNSIIERNRAMPLGAWTTGATMEISDHNQEDISVMKENYPHLRNWPVEVSIVDGSLWKYR